MADIFISYKREDKAVAERLERALEQLGFDVWWDFELLSGDRFRKVIEKVIDQCGAAVVLWSQLARESEFVLDEATYAKEQNKLCPARLDDCRLPMGFGQAQVADLRNWQGEISNPGFDELVRSIEAKTGKKARLGARARTEVGEAKLEELDAFKAAEIAGSAPALKTFLQQFPNGLFGDFVRAQLAGLGEAVAPPLNAAAPKPAPPRRQPTPEPLKAAAPPKQTPSFFSGERKVMLIAGGLALFVTIAAVVTWGLMKQPPLKPAQPPSQPTAVVATNTAPLGTPGKDPVAKTDIFDSLMIAPLTPYDLTKLDPDVRRAVQDARSAEIVAEDDAGRARAAVADAIETATRAHKGESGYRISDTAEMHYEGAWTSDAPSGAGTATYRGNGGAYSGQFHDGLRSGYGVFTYDSRAEGEPERFEGEWLNQAMNGMGVFYWRSGEIYKGRMRNDQKAGVGVYSLPDGSRYEGQYADNQRNGYGVEWDAKGNARFTGFWAKNELSKDLSGTN